MRFRTILMALSPCALAAGFVWGLSVADDELSGELSIADVAGLSAVESSPTSAAPTTVPAPCTVARSLELGDTGEAVHCLERTLMSAGFFVGEPDDRFDEATQLSVADFQRDASAASDGVAGPRTIQRLGIWTGDAKPDADPQLCVGTGRSAVIDREHQQAYLCRDGGVVDVFDITSAVSQPDPGEYAVTAKVPASSSNFSGEYSTMENFIVFTVGKFQGARVGFHSVPINTDGVPLQPLKSVGTAEHFGDSSGCIRVLPDVSVELWGFLEVGDPVIVVS